MINFEGVQWVAPKSGDDQSLLESRFSVLPEPLILEIFHLAGKQNLSSLSLVCHLFHRISYDRTLISDDFEAIVAVLKQLFSTMREGNVYLEELDCVIGSEVPLALKLLKLTSWSKQLVGALPFETMISWSPVFDPPANLQRTYLFVNDAYTKLWKKHINQKLTDYNHVNLGYSFHDGAFERCLDLLIEKGSVPHLLIGEDLSQSQVEKLSEAIESGRLAMDAFSFCGSPSIDQLKKDRLLQALSRCAGLKKMSFSLCNLLDPDIERIGELFRMHAGLEELSISGYSFSMDGIGNLLTMYEQAPSLSVLGLGGCSDGELREVIEQLEGSRLRELRVSSLSLFPETENAIIWKMNESSTVERLHLHYSDYSARAAFEFMERSIEGSPFYQVEGRSAHQIDLIKL